MGKALFLVALFVSLNASLAAAMDCRAKVALNRVYDVSLDTDTKALTVKTDNGYVYSGTASAFFSPSAKSTTYYLSSGFTTGILVELEEVGAKRVALCLKDNECYLCK